MLLEKITDSVSWVFRITLAKIRTFSWLFQHPCPISGLFRTSGNPDSTLIRTHSLWYEYDYR